VFVSSREELLTEIEVAGLYSNDSVLYTYNVTSLEGCADLIEAYERSIK
jgi:hypothetical protein